MADLFIRTYTFVDGTIAYGSQVEYEIDNIVTLLNNLNTAATNWGQVSALHATQVPLVADVSSGSQHIADFKNNSVIKASISSTGVLTLKPTSNQVVLGTTNTTTISATAPSASRVITLPDPGTDASFVMTEGTQTINGTKTFGTPIAVGSGGTGQSSYTDGQLLIGNTTGNTLAKATLTGTSNQVIVTNGGGSITLSTPQSIGTASTPTFASETLTAVSNQLVLGTTRTVTVTAPTPASSSRVVTIPDLSGDYSVVGTIAAQSIGGVKTFTGGAGAITMSGSTIAMGANKITGLADGSATTDAAAFGQLNMTLLSTGTASSSASIDFTSISNSTYDSYIIIGTKIVPATNAVGLTLRFSVSGSFKSGASDYTHQQFRYVSGGSGSSGSTGDTAIWISSSSDAMSNSASGGMSFCMQIYNCAQTTTVKRATWHGVSLCSANQGIIGSGSYVTAADAVDGFRFLMSSGNISTGVFKLYGVRG